jgi:predicted nucleic acid-binding Zn ribbon protein
VSKPTAIGDILKRQLAVRGVARRVREATAEQIWPEVVGAEIAAHTQVTRTDAGRVFVSVDSGTWRHELLYHKEALIAKLNEALSSDGGSTTDRPAGEAIIRDIMFLGPS